MMQLLFGGGGCTLEANAIAAPIHESGLPSGARSFTAAADAGTIAGGHGHDSGEDRAGILKLHSSRY
jgi:hypothetical protein